MDARDFVEFVDTWMSRKENVGSSFTYWRALYDWVREGRFDLDDLDIRYDTEQSIISASWANEERVSYLSDEAVVEIMDIAELQELGERLQEQVDDEDKQDVFEEIDTYPNFETRKQYEETVQKIVEETGNRNLNWKEVAEEYEDEYPLHIDEEEDTEE